MSTDTHQTKPAESSHCHRRVRNMVHCICFIALMKPEHKYVMPMVHSFDFSNFETKLREIMQDAANNN